MGSQNTCTDTEPRELASAQALYVFCVIPNTDSVVATDGLEGAPVGSVCGTRVRAICCPVELEAWTGERGAHNLSDIQWIGPQALRHELVNEQQMAAGPTLPLRFGTLFSSRARVEQWLAANSDTMYDFLLSVDGAEEWAVRGWLCDRRCEDELAAQDPRVADLPASKGARYLQQKRLRRDAASRVREWVAETGKQVNATLLDACMQVKSCTTTTVKARHPTSDRCVLNFACLLPRGQIERLRDELDERARMWEPFGLTFELNGPWPPYNFSPDLVPNSK